jgi:hypothetical protein
MMPRKLAALNLALAAVGALLIVYTVRTFMTSTPLPAANRRPPPPPVAAAAPESPRPPAGSYGVVTARNLFSPTRTEAPVSTTTAGAVPVAKPNLYGVVVRESGSIAYLEDPSTKRVSGYRVGDRIVGGTVQTIKSDGVTIDSPGGALDVRLREPGKPRPAQPAAAAAPPTAPTLPGVIPPAAPGAPTAAAHQPGAQPPVAAQQPPVQLPPAQGATVVPPGTPPSPPPIIPGRRPLPPNLLRRLPPGTGDAPQQ